MVASSTSPNPGRRAYCKQHNARRDPGTARRAHAAKGSWSMTLSKVVNVNSLALTPVVGPNNSAASKPMECRNTSGMSGGSSQASWAPTTADAALCAVALPEVSTCFRMSSTAHCLIRWASFTLRLTQSVATMALSRNVASFEKLTNGKGGRPTPGDSPPFSAVIACCSCACQSKATHCNSVASPTTASKTLQASPTDMALDTSSLKASKSLSPRASCFAAPSKRVFTLPRQFAMSAWSTACCGSSLRRRRSAN
mmetsp:Transcript_108222/g.304972  ORF Transcript_108222/g.304972 Transcript_108222/m.304972 type:complete len:254 (-) Transcript_108222:618-1379(-)